MIKPETLKTLGELGNTHYGSALKEYLNEQLDTLRDVSNCTSWDDTLGRQHAVKIIDKLFHMLEKKKPIVGEKTSYD